MLEGLMQHHLAGLDGEERTLIRFRCTGVGVAEIARSMSLSESAVRRRLERVQNAIFVPLCIERDSWASGFWAAQHLSCCLGTVFSA